MPLLASSIPFHPDGLRGQRRFVKNRDNQAARVDRLLRNRPSGPDRWVKMGGGAAISFPIALRRTRSTHAYSEREDLLTAQIPPNRPLHSVPTAPRMTAPDSE